mgnify:CR=1 FL=1
MGFDSAISGLSATQAPLATCTKKRLRYREVCACRYNNYRTAIYLKNGARISGLYFSLLEKGFDLFRKVKIFHSKINFWEGMRREPIDRLRKRFSSSPPLKKDLSRLRILIGLACLTDKIADLRREKDERQK